MKRYRFWSVLFLAPALGMLVSAGCSSDKGTSEKPKDIGARKDEKGGGSGGAKEALEIKATGDLKGRVVFEGESPALQDFTDQINKLDDVSSRSRCLAGDHKDPTWRVSSDKGLSNVVVWLRAPKDKYFDVPEAQRKNEEAVSMDQPYCAFEPHVVVLYPSFYNPKTKKQERTGQKFMVKNSAPMPHNTAWQARYTVGDNKIIKPRDSLEVTAKASSDTRPGGEDQISIRCDIHKFMSAYAWAFDHPYAAVSKADGTYEIKNAPAGVEVALMYWHESFGPKPQELKKVTLKEGSATTEEIKIKK